MQNVAANTCEIWTTAAAAAGKEKKTGQQADITRSEV